MMGPINVLQIVYLVFQARNPTLKCLKITVTLNSTRYSSIFLEDIFANTSSLCSKVGYKNLWILSNTLGK